MADWELDPEFERIATEVANGVDLLRHESDRGCALVAAVVLDEMLGNLLKAYLQDSPAGIVSALLDLPNAPLGTFSARIKMLRALGVLPSDVFHDLELIREIRNLAAHFDRRRRMGFGTGFAVASVASRCSRLKCLPSKWPATLPPRLAFETVVGMFAAVLNEHVLLSKVAADNASVEFARSGMHDMLPSLDVRIRKYIAKGLPRLIEQARKGKTAKRPKVPPNLSLQRTKPARSRRSGR